MNAVGASEIISDGMTREQLIAQQREINLLGRGGAPAPGFVALPRMPLDLPRQREAPSAGGAGERVEEDDEKLNDEPEPEAASEEYEEKWNEAPEPEAARAPAQWTCGH